MIFIDFENFFEKFEFLTIFSLFLGQIWGKISDFGNFLYPILDKKSIEICNIAFKWPKILISDPCMVFLKTLCLNFWFLPPKNGVKVQFWPFLGIFGYFCLFFSQKGDFFGEKMKKQKFKHKFFKKTIQRLLMSIFGHLTAILRISIEFVVILTWKRAFFLYIGICLYIDKPYQLRGTTKWYIIPLYP